MSTPLIQPTFTGGELSPSLHGRVDIERYGNSLAKATNFIVRPTGGIVNRPGFQYLGDPAGQCRLIPFLYSTSVAYVVELSNLKARFWANGALVESGGSPVEVVTPYTTADLYDVSFTQSADVLILVHPSYAPRKISRTSATAFSMALFTVKEGPFAPLNADEAVKVAASAETGAVDVTANANIFSADHVGTLLYIEQKSLGQVKPWAPGDRGVAVGNVRRSDGKTYKATAIAPGGTSWHETGGVRPIHDEGKEWDGPGDTRTDGTYTWSVGVEWEYLDSGYGIVRIDTYNSAASVSGTVLRRLPNAVIGGLGAPTSTWTPTGDGVTKAFTISGAASNSRYNYSVTIDGVPQQADPNYTPVDDFYLGLVGTF